MKRITPADLGDAWARYMCSMDRIDSIIHDLMVSCFLADADIKIAGMRKRLAALRDGVMP